MVDQLLLNDTLQKINASLNRRFEKDADLYISKQDEYEIKKNLCKEAYGGVVDMAKAKGISHDIIVKVIMRNAGILNVGNVRKFRKALKPVFIDADYKALSYMMEDVLSGNVYMQKNIRHILFSYYMNGITDKMRIDYWENAAFSFDLTERTELFHLILEKTKHRGSIKVLKFKVDFVQEAFRRYPGLMTDDVFLRLKSSLNEKEQAELFGYLCQEMKAPSIDNDSYNFIIMNAYASYKEQAFNDALSHIESASPRNFKQYVRGICMLFRSEEDVGTLLIMFDQIYEAYRSKYMKSHVKDEIEKKVWKIVKGNPDICIRRAARIGSLKLDTKKNKKYYTSFDEIKDALSNNTQPVSIAYLWGNMRPPVFQKSILKSFTDLRPVDLMPMNEAYDWLFKHSLRRGNIKELNLMCERLAEPLHKFSSGNHSSEYYNALDRLWVNYVVKYKLQGSKIEAYMFKQHFNKVKEWKK